MRGLFAATLVISLAACVDDPETVSGSSGGGGVVSEDSSSSSSSSGDSDTATSMPAGSSSTSSTSSTSEGHGSSDSSSTGGFACNSTCGSGTIECGEECDCGPDATCSPEELDFQTCLDITDPLQPGVVFTGGTLGCIHAACRFDIGACEWGCGDGIIGENETCEPRLEASSCADLGLGDATDPLPCDEMCQLDTSAC